MFVLLCLCCGVCVVVQKEASEYMASCDGPDYLNKVAKRLEEEGERVKNYLDPSTEAKITAVLEKQLIQKQVKWLRRCPAQCCVHIR
jgi:Cullin family